LDIDAFLLRAKAISTDDAHLTNAPRLQALGHLLFLGFEKFSLHVYSCMTLQELQDFYTVGLITTLLSFAYNIETLATLAYYGKLLHKSKV
jgi:hypothetical protein